VKITYARPGGETTVYQYDPDDLLMSEVKAVEKTAGLPLDLVEFQVQAGGLTERLIVLWVLMRREDKGLRLADLEKTVRRRDLTVEFDRAERASMRERITKATHLDEDQRAAVIAMLDADDDADPEPEVPASPPKEQPA
jgi:hypothetical protein